ncbi:hypothetical protein AXF42_Ash013498 [Apostasia shenzhenica]|uniref:Uncharacterized protein n=1 Tax=Apostasia shenzhenica TaxID=1088818 RepID=A0A2I0A4E2_9ASPA|nr:hypothetical protein AXF42_Ash013498 [Apostasia shenzhenica]
MLQLLLALWIILCDTLMLMIIIICTGTTVFIFNILLILILLLLFESSFDFFCLKMYIWFFAYRYAMSYEGSIATLSNKEKWDNSSFCLYLQPLITTRPRGHPKEKRARSFLEKNHH